SSRCASFEPGGARAGTKGFLLEGAFHPRTRRTQMKLYQFFVPALCTLALAACSDRSAELAQDDVVRTGARGESSDCTPLETRRPNATDQQPAFEGQTRACGVTSNVQFDVQVVAGGLEH